MTQHSYDIANQGGAAFRADLNNALKALANLSAGASAPSTTYAYMPWFDTTTGLLKFRNGSNTAWVISGPAADSTQAALYVNNLVKLLIDSSGDATFSGLIRGVAGAAATPSISFSSDTNTGIYSIAADILGISAGGAEALRISTTAVSVKKALNTAKATDIVSAGSIDIGAADGNYINITGTTAITALGTADAGIVRTLNFTGILTFTHNATSLILPGAANITTAAGDIFEMTSLGGGNWKCTCFTPAVGNVNKVAQVIVATTNTDGSTTTAIPFDNTVPQNTEGAAVSALDVTITPKSSTSTLMIEVDIPIVGMSAANHWIGALFKDSDASAIAAGMVTPTNATYQQQFKLRYFVSAGSTSARTYKFRYGPNVGTAYFLRVNTASVMGGAAQASVTVTEILA